MGADAFTQIPDANHASLISTDQLTLVWMNDYIVDWSSVNIIALKTASSCIPHLHSAILRARDHPLALTVECDTSDVVGVTLEGHNRIGIRRLDVIEFDIVMAGGGEEAFVGSNT